MYKSQSRAEQFMTRTGSFSTHGSRGGVDLLGGGEAERLSPDQQRAAIVAALRAVEAEITDLRKIDRAGMPLRRKEDLNAALKALGTKKFEFQRQLAELRPQLVERRSFQDIGHFIIEVMKERLTKPEWDVLVREANRRFQAQGQPEE